MLKQNVHKNSAPTAIFREHFQYPALYRSAANSDSQTQTIVLSDFFRSQGLQREMSRNVTAFRAKSPDVTIGWAFGAVEPIGGSGLRWFYSPRRVLAKLDRPAADDLSSEKKNKNENDLWRGRHFFDRLLGSVRQPHDWCRLRLNAQWGPSTTHGRKINEYKSLSGTLFFSFFLQSG